MAKDRAKIELTGREVDELHSLLSAVLSNSDQWDAWDLRAISRADAKLVDAIRKAIG